DNAPRGSPRAAEDQDWRHLDEHVGRAATGPASGRSTQATPGADSGRSQTRSAGAARHPRSHFVVKTWPTSGSAPMEISESFRGLHPCNSASRGNSGTRAAYYFKNAMTTGPGVHATSAPVMPAPAAMTGATYEVALLSNFTSSPAIAQEF